MIAVCFWTFSALILYPYVLYPPLIAAAGSLFARRSVRAGDDQTLPTVSLLIAAHNEASIIAERIEDALSTDYPTSHFEIVVASDGSTDGTAEVVRTFADRGVRLLDFPVRRGKAAVLNDSMAALHGEIVILSDANTKVDPGAAKSLIRWFASPSVGAVCGRLVLVDARTGRNADGLYWKFETLLKKCEAKLDALLGANGAIYALRRRLYVPIPEGTIVDDFVIPLLAKLRSGCQIIYDQEAVAIEETAPDIRAEFRRRSRIGAGGFQSLRLLWPLMDPRRGWIAFAFVSHKLLRWLGPFFLIGAFISNLLLLNSPFFRIMLAVQVAFYTISALERWIPAGRGISKALRLAAMFTSMNAALFVGFCRWATGRQGGTWQPTMRSSGVGKTA